MRWLVWLGLLGVWACGDDDSRSAMDVAGASDLDASMGDAGQRPDPDCGDDVELSGVQREEPPDLWRSWDEAARACLEEHDIATGTALDELLLFRADAIDVKGETAGGALVCARGAIVVNADAWLDGTLPRALVIANVEDEADRKRAVEACGAPADGPRCGADFDQAGLEPFEPPAVYRDWYDDALACLEELHLEPRYDFDELSFWTSPSVEIATLCTDGALVLPAQGLSEDVLRYTLARVNTDALEDEELFDACVEPHLPAP